MGRLDGPAARLTFLQARLRESLPRLLQGWGRERARLTALTTGLWRERLTVAERRLERLDLELGGVDPQAPLRRGYALVRGPDGALLRSVAGVQPGAAVSVRLADGSLEAEVRQVRRGGE
ncbi:exodeoxyribonuclease VII large subunit [uncultured Desulfovibrio sp.]|uniref:exodeoxyribonuclease VII large subunit n=1 Tax=uncultured Desulfovibrio sp. TaxID=167968 RepID=UPI00338E18E9